MRVLPLFLFACTSPKVDSAVDPGPDSPADTSPPEFPSTAVDVSSDLESIRAEYDLPALGGARLEDGVVTALGVTGVRARGAEPEALWSDKWHLGSCTKAMTGTLVSRLVVEGVLAWDETLETLLPELTLTAEDAALTPTQLLSHQAGLATNIPSSIWSVLWEDGDVMEQRAWFAQEILALDTAQPIGTYAYSNSGYMVVGAALEERTGSSWEALMQEHLFDPLGMDSCGFGNAAVDPSVPDEPWPHGADGAAIPPGPGDDNPPALGPAGTVHCSLVDWGRFVAAHVERDTDFLPEEQWDHLHAPAVDQYAMGWLAVERSWGEGTVLTHNGSNTLNFAVVWAAPETGALFLAATNQGDAGAATDAVVGSLIP